MIEKIKKNLINIPGKRLNGKYIILESDDWGSIRTPNRQTLDNLIKKNLVSSKDPFARYDCLESESDLTALFDVLSKFKDINSNPAVITANTVVCNPDFEKIAQSGFSQYFYEPFTETLKTYPEHHKVFEIMTSGIENKLYAPQFHAREHLNVPIWLELLKTGNKEFLEAFKYRCFSIDYISVANRRNNIMAAFDYNSAENLEFIKNSIQDGLKIFEQIFKHPSITAVAPCYVWDNNIEEVLKQSGVTHLQGSRFQQMPIIDSQKFKTVFHYNGEVNAKKQTYFSRNCLFEPSVNEGIDWVSKCMESIDIAFKWKKPAIIGTHRLNFSGTIFPENRIRNLKLLKQLLTAVQKKWPDVEFISTAGLAEKYKAVK